LDNLKIANYPLEWADKLTMINDPTYKIKRYELIKGTEEWNLVYNELQKTVPT